MVYSYCLLKRSPMIDLCKHFRQKKFSHGYSNMAWSNCEPSPLIREWHILYTYVAGVLCAVWYNTCRRWIAFLRMFIMKGWVLVLLTRLNWKVKWLVTESHAVSTSMLHICHMLKHKRFGAGYFWFSQNDRTQTVSSDRANAELWIFFDQKMIWHIDLWARNY